jgi:hypothetical protein
MWIFVLLPVSLVEAVADSTVYRYGTVERCTVHVSTMYQGTGTFQPARHNIIRIIFQLWRDKRHHKETKKEPSLLSGISIR